MIWYTHTERERLRDSEKRWRRRSQSGLKESSRFGFGFKFTSDFLQERDRETEKERDRVKERISTLHSMQNADFRQPTADCLHHLWVGLSFRSWKLWLWVDCEPVVGELAKLTSCREFKRKRKTGIFDLPLTSFSFFFLSFLFFPLLRRLLSPKLNRLKSTHLN